ncbi:MAG: hypothetical protein V4479_12195 [Actinomycetota bacterium]
MSGIGAAPVPGDQSLCIPLLGCGSPSPSPSPSSGGGGGLIGGIVGGATGGAVTPDVSQPLVDPVFDPGAPIFTQPSAQLGGDSISFSGLKAVSVVAVRLIDGTEIPCLKLQADDIVITGFYLDVRRATGPSLVSTAPRMELRGNVSVYVNSVTASTLDGLGISLGAQTPPPDNELPPQLLRINLGLVGVTADSITYAGSHQQLHD